MKGKTTRRIAALMLAAMVTVPAFGTTVMAAQPTNPEYIDYNADGSSTFVKNNKAAIKALADGIFAHQETISLSSYNIPTGSVQALRDALFALYPELFFIDPVFSYSVSSGKILYIKPDYLYDKDTCSRMLAEFYAEADYYLDQVSGELSVCRDDFSKALILHDELVLDANYKIGDNSQYNFMINKYGLCENYTKVYAYLLSQMGIYNEIVDSSSMVHEWLKVKLGSDYYLVDVTWDDPTPDRPGLVSHKYFLLSDAGDQNLDRYHYSYNTNHTSANTKYDNAKYHNFASKMCKLSASDNYVYAADKSTTAIVRYDYVNDTSTKLIDLSSERWSAGVNSYWQGIYAGVGSFDGKMYYNTPSAIYCYDPSNNTKTKITGNNYGKEYYGLQISGDKLYAVTASDPNSTGTKVLIKQLEKQTAAVTSVSLDNTALSLKEGSTAKLNASVLPSNASNKNISWTTSDSSVATVKDGTVTAVSAGTAKITASSNNGKTAVCTVTVTASTVYPTALNLNTASLTIENGKTAYLTATVSPDNATNKTVTWSSSDTSVATVTNGKVTALKAGTCKISAATINGKTASASVTVLPVLNNTSVINSDKVQVGDKVRISGAANGGAGGYTFAYYYKRSTSSTWKTLGTEFGTNSSVAFAPTSAGTFDVKVIAKDSSGTTKTKTFTVTALEELELTNVSVVGRESIKLGTAIPMIGKAVGGSGEPYTYSFYFKRSTNTAWKLLGDKFTSTASARFKPTATGTYDIRIDVKDGNGTIVKKFFTATVK